ncbi:laccase-15-like [Aegilops tauschii subsp. strangulata]|uniref:Laccase-15 n=1 Tax=Aegilops tauschii TaxID=37682 RepID=M8AVV6_AEGTA
MINGKLGDLSNCSGFIEDNYVLNVEHAETYLLRIVNAALHEQYNFKIAGHEFTVVAIDANYVKPYMTDTIVIASGETVDSLLVANAPPGRYYMVTQAMQSPKPFIQIPVLMSRGIVSYYQSNRSTDDTPIMAPEMPDQHNATTSFYFRGNLTSLLPQEVPANVDEQLFVGVDVGNICSHDGSHDNYMVTRLNISFQLPMTTSLLQAHYYNSMSTTVISMLKEFPRWPPSSEFGYSLTSVGTANPYSSGLFSISNPMHLHGHDFFILGQGLGRYDTVKDVQAYDLVDPPMKNTALAPIYGWTSGSSRNLQPGIHVYSFCKIIAVFQKLSLFCKNHGYSHEEPRIPLAPPLGWTAIRFIASNPAFNTLKAVSFNRGVVRALPYGKAHIVENGFSTRGGEWTDIRDDSSPASGRLSKL